MLTNTPIRVAARRLSATETATTISGTASHSSLTTGAALQSAASSSGFTAAAANATACARRIGRLRFHDFLFFLFFGLVVGGDDPVDRDMRLKCHDAATVRVDRSVVVSGCADRDPESPWESIDV